MKKLLLPILIGTLLPSGAAAETLDFSKIEHWSGSGPNKAAFVLSLTPDKDQKNPGTLVWGYRWEAGEEPTGFDMLKAVAAASSDFIALVQYTGEMGYTFDGGGFAKDINDLAEHLSFDFDGASGDGSISFGYFSPNTGMNQTSAPGSEAIALAAEAIDKAKSTHLIIHPLDAATYGYPAYDYDWWKLDRTACKDPAHSYWNAGWYNGYWSYRVGDTDIESLGYSGLGMSSVTLLDGDVHGWKYNDFGGASSDEWGPLNYRHEVAATVGIADVRAESEDAREEWYRLDGTTLEGRPEIPGIYILRKGATHSKILVK